MKWFRKKSTENRPAEIRHNEMPELDMDRLKPCPFCGTDGELYYSIAYYFELDPEGTATRVFIHCRNCGMQSKGVACARQDNVCGAVAVPVEGWEDELVGLWNTRKGGSE